MKKKVKMMEFTPVLVAILVVITLFQANADRLPWSQLLLPLGISIQVALFYIGIFALNPFTQKAMPVIASVFTLVTLMFFTITPIGSLIVLILTVTLCLVFPRYAPSANMVIGVMVSIGVVTSIILSLTATPFNFNLENRSQVGSQVGSKPNIYFIIPDRMPSPAAMRASNIDPSAVITKLRALGFYVKEDQLSADPYVAGMGTKDLTTTRTMRFFASVLNGGQDVPLDMNYADNLALINNPGVFRELHNLGYTITNAGSWFQETKKIAGADANLKYQDASFMERLFQDELAVAFWNRTVLSGFNFRRLESQNYQGNLERGRTNWQYSEVILTAATKPQSSQFIMAHVLMPHEPFVFQADGSPVAAGLSQVEAYYQQIQYAATFLGDLAQGIRTRDPSAIIIIQSDEGMGYRKPAALNFTLTPIQWNGVFSAWYIPDT